MGLFKTFRIHFCHLLQHWKKMQIANFEHFDEKIDTTKFLKVSNLILLNLKLGLNIIAQRDMSEWKVNERDRERQS